MCAYFLKTGGFEECFSSTSNSSKLTDKVKVTIYCTYKNSNLIAVFIYSTGISFCVLSGGVSAGGITVSGACGSGCTCGI